MTKHLAGNSAEKSLTTLIMIGTGEPFATLTISTYSQGFSFLPEAQEAHKHNNCNQKKSAVEIEQLLIPVVQVYEIGDYGQDSRS